MAAETTDHNSPLGTNTSVLHLVSDGTSNMAQLPLYTYTTMKSLKQLRFMSKKTMTADPVSKLSLKLLIDSKSNKVLFAEAGKDFVDFLFNLLSLPVGTVIELLETNSRVGSLGSLYKSIENLSETYMQPNQKDSLLNPRAFTSASSVPLLLPYDVAGKVYMCRHYHSNVADDPRTVCPRCKELMSNEVPVLAPDVGRGEVSDGGFVKGVVTYMVMDDLEVKPMSTISIITMLNKFNVKEVGALQEKVADKCVSGKHESLNSSSASCWGCLSNGRCVGFVFEFRKATCP